MSTFLKPLLVREKLLKQDLKIFTPVEFSRIFNLNTWQVKYFLAIQESQGLILKLKRGLYSLKTDPPSEEEIANKLYQPSYISFEYALAKYNILPEATYQITSITTKPTRNFTVGNIQYSYLTVKKSVYSGYLAQRSDSNSPVFLIAEPEKAFADWLYFVSLGKKTDNDRLNLTSLDKNRVFEFIKLFNRPKLYQMAKEKLT